MHLRGMEVWVECGGKRLSEYSTKMETSKDGDAISCFIPSEAGKVRGKFPLAVIREADAYT